MRQSTAAATLRNTQSPSRNCPLGKAVAAAAAASAGWVQAMAHGPGGRGRWPCCERAAVKFAVAGAELKHGRRAAAGGCLQTKSMFSNQTRSTATTSPPGGTITVGRRPSAPRTHCPGCNRIASAAQGLLASSSKSGGPVDWSPPALFRPVFAGSFLGLGTE